MLFGICIFGEKDSKKQQSKIGDSTKTLSYQMIENLDKKNQLDLTHLDSGFTWELDIEKKDVNIKNISNLFGLLSNDNITPKPKLQQIEMNIDEDYQIDNIDDTEIINIFRQTKVPKEWQDPETKLIWEVKTQSNFERLYNYNEALDYAKSLNRTFYSNSNRWRVPTIDELLTLGSIHLFDYRAKSSKFNAREAWKKVRLISKNGKVFVKKPLSGIMNRQLETWYWSATEVEPYSEHPKRGTEKQSTVASDEAWSVNFFEGGNYRNNKDQKNHIICVRTTSKLSQ